MSSAKIAALALVVAVAVGCTLMALAERNGPSLEVGKFIGTAVQPPAVVPALRDAADAPRDVVAVATRAARRREVPSKRASEPTPEAPECPAGCALAVNWHLEPPIDDSVFHECTGVSLSGQTSDGQLDVDPGSVLAGFLGVEFLGHCDTYSPLTIAGHRVIRFTYVDEIVGQEVEVEVPGW